MCHRVATPKAPLAWEGRPRRLRGTAGGTHRNDTRAVSLPKTESIIHCERSHNLGGPVARRDGYRAIPGTTRPPGRTGERCCPMC